MHLNYASAAVTWGTAGDTTWYVVNGTNVQLSKGAICAGDVRLILADNAKLTATGDNWATGIEVSGSNNSLTIYGQTSQSGQLIATGGEGGAGIGGGDGTVGRNITINGGIITATGRGEAAPTTVIAHSSAMDMGSLLNDNAKKYVKIEGLATPYTRTVPTVEQPHNAPLRVMGAPRGQATDLETVDGASEHSDKCTMHDGKYIINGQFVIVKDGKMYNAQGF